MTMMQLHSTSFNNQSADEQTAFILIVDDEKALRVVLRRAMEGEGYRAVDVSSAERCLFLCQQELPDIILLDAMMSGIDGFECCRRLKAKFGDRCPAILIVSALYDQESVDKAFAAGAADFMTKPIHWAVLRQRVKQLLKNHQCSSQWQATLIREQLLKDQLAAERQRTTHLAELCRLNGITISV